MATVLIAFLVIMFLGVPLALAMGAAGLIGLGNLNIVVMAQQLFVGLNSFTMIAAPFFILMGNLMNTGGVTRKMFRFANVIVGTVPGGMGHANVLCSALFAGMSGTPAFLRRNLRCPPEICDTSLRTSASPVAVPCPVPAAGVHRHPAQYRPAK